MQHYGPIFVVAIAATVGAIFVDRATEEQSQLIARGKVLAATMDCTGCHSGGNADRKRLLAGDVAGIDVPGFGRLYPPNLTPDEATGIGTWTKAEIVTAIRMGVRPDGRPLAPVPGWHGNDTLTDADSRAIAAYLKSLWPVRSMVPSPVAAGPQPMPSDLEFSTPN